MRAKIVPFFFFGEQSLSLSRARALSPSLSLSVSVSVLFLDSTQGPLHQPTPEHVASHVELEHLQHDMLN